MEMLIKIGVSLYVFGLINFVVYAFCETFDIGQVGFEPTNCGFRVRCLTVWRLPINLSHLKIVFKIKVHVKLK